MDVETIDQVFNLNQYDLFYNQILLLDEKENIFNNAEFEVIAYSVYTKFYSVKCQYNEDNVTKIKYFEIKK